MYYGEQSEDYRPLFWIQGRPIYANTAILLGHVIAFVALALAIAFVGDGAILALRLDPERVWHGEVWRLASYIIFPPQIMFIFAVGFLYFAGKETEQFIGRKSYLQLFAALVLVPAVLYCVAGLLLSLDDYQSGWESIFGVFVAFATIYPGVTLNIWFVNLTAHAWAWTLLGVFSLVDLAFHNWPGLYFLWCDAAVGFGTMRLMGAGRGMTWLTDWIETRRAQKLARQRNIRIVRDQKANASIDAILEKISKQGVGSLSPEERAVLERARVNLLKRDQR